MLQALECRSLASSRLGIIDQRGRTSARPQICAPVRPGSLPSGLSAKKEDAPTRAPKFARRCVQYPRRGRGSRSRAPRCSPTSWARGVRTNVEAMPRLPSSQHAARVASSMPSRYAHALGVAPRHEWITRSSWDRRASLVVAVVAGRSPEALVAGSASIIAGGGIRALETAIAVPEAGDARWPMAVVVEPAAITGPPADVQLFVHPMCSTQHTFLLT